VFRSAIVRRPDHIAVNIKPHFPADINLSAAVAMLDYLIEKKMGSGICSPGQCGPRVDVLERSPTWTLTRQSKHRLSSFAVLS
jgi:hypothetical protein